MATSYDSLANDKVLFLQGTQAKLNKYFANYVVPSGEDDIRGTAVEGAFYLTTDTHRLYVGRKVLNSTNVYPVQISEGITTVANSTELATYAANARDGDFYYVVQGNVLAVRDSTATGGWRQLNPPTGIDDVTMTASAEEDESHNATGNVIVNVSVETDGGSESGTLKLVAGDNVTLTPSQDNTSVTISSQNSQSTLAVATNTSRGEVVLSDGVNADTKVYLTGASDVKVTSAVSGGENIVTITGPEVQGVVTNNRGDSASPTGNTHGFEIVTKVKPGGSSSASDRTITNDGSVFDPVIDYGTNSSAYFYGGHAKLDVYSKSEADTAIANAITSQLQTADAMTYKGIVDATNKITTTTATGSIRKDAHIGDTYKVVVPSETSTVDTAGYKYLQFSQKKNGTGASETITIRTGDLLIANGVEYQNTDANAAGYTTNAALVGTLNPETMYWDVIPAGDEPKLIGAVLAGDTDPYFALQDANNGSSNTLKVTFDNANSNLIQAVGVGNNANDYKVRLYHKSVARTDDLTVAPATAGTNDADAIGASGIKLFALTSTLTDSNSKSGGIITDAQGHITNVKGKVITLKHNYLKSISATHSATSATANGITTYTGSIALSGENSITGLNTTGASISLLSDTFKITANGANTQLTMDLVWDSF